MGMDSVVLVQNYVLLVLGVAAFGMEVFALADALRRDPKAFEVAEKRTRNFWLIVLGIATAVGFVNLFSVTSLVGLLAVIAAGIYLADVRPAVTPYDRRRPGGRGSGGSGPYRSW